MACIKKRDGQKDAWMESRMSQKQYAPPTFSKLGELGLKMCLKEPDKYSKILEGKQGSDMKLG